MKQPSKKKNTVKKKEKQKRLPKVHQHPKFGTSKLEEKFAKEFLERLGVEYIYQFEAKDIGRFYDFRVVNGPIIEIQGSYWHGDPRLYEEKDLNKTQKRAQRVDEHKKKWALMHGIPIYYVWEKDINENPEKVMKFLKEILYIENKKEEKKKRHKNKLFL